MKIGDKVTFYYWIGGDAGKMYSSPATVTTVFDADALPQALALLVDFPDEIVKTEGFLPAQSHARQLVGKPDTINDSGSWSSP